MTAAHLWMAGLCFVAGACRIEPAVQISFPTPTPALREEDAPALEQPQLEIIDLQEKPSADQKWVTLTGTLRNRGTGATHQLLVRVEARDENDVVVVSTDAAPSGEQLPPGGTATFTVTVENRRDVVRYHVETLAR